MPRPSSDSDSDFDESPPFGGFVMGPTGGAHLFSPTGSEGTHARARSIMPGVRPREAPQAPYSNRRGQTNYGSEIRSQPPPSFNVGEHSGRSNARQIAPPSTPPNQTDREDGPNRAVDSRVVSPSTAALIKQLRDMQDLTEAGASSPDMHPAIHHISKTSADVLNKIWNLRGLAKPGEAENVMDVSLMNIITGLVDEYRTAQKLAKELEDEKDKAQRLDQEAAHAREKLVRAEEQARKERAQYDTFSKQAKALIDNLTVRLRAKDENEERLKETIRGLKDKEAARELTIKNLSDQVASQLNLGSSGSVRPGRSNVRPSAMEFQQQVLASASSAERLRSRPTERPSGASDFGSPQPKRSSMATMSTPVVESDDVKLWRGKFEKLHAVVRNYTKQYWKYTPRDFASSVQNDQSVWQQLLKAAHQTNPEAAQAFVTRLVSERPSIQYLVERVIGQFVVEEIFSFNAWMEWDPKTDEKLKKIEQRLKETNLLDSTTRMEIISKRCSMISARIAHPKWNEWKSFRKSATFQQLRGLVLPLAAVLKEKEDAIYDLFTVLEEAWEIAPQIMNSNFSFKFEYPLPGQVLTNDVQNTLDVKYNENQQQQMLEYHQGPASSGAMVRGGRGVGGAGWGNGRLIVTPLISMRDERVAGGQATIVVKTDVLVRS